MFSNPAKAGFFVSCLNHSTPHRIYIWLTANRFSLPLIPILTFIQHLNEYIRNFYKTQNMKQFFTLLILILGSIQIFAQNSATLKGKLIDTTNKQSLKDASISVLDAKDSTVEVFSLTKVDGSFELKGISFGKYILQISFSGYEAQFQNLEFSKTTNTIDLGSIYLKPAANELGGVTVKASPVQIKGDTTEFNAGSFKTKPNATAEDLLKKLPGVQVEKDGTVKAQGQNVTRVLVDGKRFFGDDPKTATRNLPTDIIDKVQVYDAQSDQSSFSGFDDGNREKTINIITKKNKRKGYFGKISAGAGDNSRYATNANFNKFNGNQQISFIGQGNNINQQNFSVQDLLGTMNSGGGGRGGGGGMFGGGGGNIGNFLTGNQSGIAKTWAAGLNYNDVWGKKTSVSSSYFFNNMNTNNDNENFRETFVTNDSSQFNTSNNFSNNKNSNHRFNFELDYKIDSFNSILIRPTFSKQHTDNFSETNSFLTKGKLVNLSGVKQSINNISDGSNFNTSILLRHRFKKRGRTISLNFTPGMSESEADGTNISFNNYYINNNLIKDTINQINSTDRNGKSYSGNISYTEPLGKRGQLELTYNYNYNRNNSDQQTMRFNKNTNVFDVVVPNLTNKFENTNTSNRFSASYREQVNKELSYTIGLGVQNAELTSINSTKGTNLSNSFVNYFPNVQLQYSKNRTKNLRFNYRGRTNAPSIAQLQDVIDNTNQLSIRNGNASLQQEFAHNFNLFYTKFDVITFKNFFVSLNGSFTQNKIGNNVTQNTGTTPLQIDGVVLIPGAQYSRPTNVNGAMNMTGFINYGFPTKKPKANINLTTTVAYTRDVNLFNNQKNYNNNYILGERISYTMNIKEQFDLNFSSFSSYTIAKYSLNPDQDGNFFTQVFSVEPTYSPKSGWIFGGDFDLTINRGQSNGFNQTIPLLNASIAKTIFKKKDGELKLSVFDLLNQNKSITRTVEQNYVQDTRTQVLTRYVMLTFTYNLRKFAGKGQQQMPPFMKGMFKGNGQPRMRMGGGGF